MIKAIGTVLVAALVWSGIAYADGRVLSVVSPSAEEVKQPAKPDQKPPAKKTARKTVKKSKRKVAAPASPGEAQLQPVGVKSAPKAKKLGKLVAHRAPGKTKKSVKPAGDKTVTEAKSAAPSVVSEPKVELLPKQQPPPKIAKVEKPKALGQSYVLFQSKPVNAEVMVDGYYAGSTPIELPIKEGNHTLRIIYPGYEEWERKFNAYKGMRVNALLVEKKQVPASP